MFCGEVTLFTYEKSRVSAVSHLNRISRGKLTKAELEALLVRDSTSTNASCLTAFCAAPWQPVRLSCSAGLGGLSKVFSVTEGCVTYSRSRES